MNYNFTKLVLLLLAFSFLTSVAHAEERYIRRAAVTGRSGPASYFDAVVVLKKGKPVKQTETLKRWAKVKSGKHHVWIPTNGLVKVKSKKYASVKNLDAGDISSSPAGLAAAAKGFASGFAKNVKAKQIETLMGHVVTADQFRSFLADFHRRHPEREASFPNEYQDPPFDAGWESKLGLAIAAKLVGHYGLVQDTKEMIELTLLAHIIGLQSARFEIPWKVFILDSDELNAFGLTDGYILVTRGLLAKCRSNAEKAAILAHEVAHVVRYHNLQELAKRKTQLKAASADMDMDAAFDEAYGEDEEDKQDKADVAELDGIAAQAYTFLHKDRLEKYEYEADHLAVVYLYRAGLSPRALVKVLKTVQSERGDVEAYSGHPAFSKRIEAINTVMDGLR